jgi:valyl-tRNA synthetase
VTERIWGELDEQGVLARASWPAPGGEARDADAESSVDEAFGFVVKLRQLRAAENLPPKAPFHVQGWPLAGVSSLVESLGGVSTEAANGAGEWRAVDVFTVGSAPVTVMAPGGAENLRPRFERELAKAAEEAERARRKLADARFVERAPAHLVEAEREKAERFEREAAELRARLADLGA